jgi:hypothetical protein
MIKPTGDEIMTTAEAPRLCVNANAGTEWWFCYHYAGTVTPGTETLNTHGECSACGKVIGQSWSSPSFLLPDSEL